MRNMAAFSVPGTAGSSIETERNSRPASLVRFQAALGSLKPQILEIQKYEISKVGPVR